MEHLFRESLFAFTFCFFIGGLIVIGYQALNYKPPKAKKED